MFAHSLDQFKFVFGHFAELFPSLDDKDDIYGRATTYFEATLSERMTARVSWVAAYDNTPTVDAGGQSLERLDNLYLFTLGWTFIASLFLIVMGSPKTAPSGRV